MEWKYISISLLPQLSGHHLSSLSEYMAVVPICYKMNYKYQTHSIPREIRQNEGHFMCFIVSPEVSGCFSSISKDTSRRPCVLYYTTVKLMKANTRKGIDVSRGIVHCGASDNTSKTEKLCTVRNALESSEKQLRSLDSYFRKLQNDANQPSSNSLNNTTEVVERSGQSNAKKGLGSLDNYLGKLNRAKLLDRSGQSRAKEGLGSLDDCLGRVSYDTKSKNTVSSASNDETTEAAPSSVQGGFGSGVKKLKNYLVLKNKDGQDGPKSSYDETSDLYLISIMASINIAVFLFEIASPIRNSNLEIFSLPVLYGAKINDLILNGEWWRLVTPMFLHSGIFHVLLGCWMLLTFGPQVCRTYGSFTFFLIYILGGLSGNLTSFLHTPELTVGGTGPVFAIIGAWLIYQIQNREVIGKDASESLLRKAVIAIALSCILSNFGPIDDWTHLGAAFTGIAYGFLTCPTLQLDDASSKPGQEEGIALVRRYADPCKSLLFFSLFVLVLISLLFITEPSFNLLATDSFR